MTDATGAGRSPRAMVAALVGITFIWGTTFVLVKEAVDRVAVFSFNAWRFTIATVLLAWIARADLRTLGRVGLVRGIGLGAAVWLGYALQTYGLETTTASKAGFITGMFVVFTPLLQAALLRRPPRRAAVVGALVAGVGLALLSLHGSLLPSLGDALVLGCAFAFALQIVGLGAWADQHPPAALAAVQMATCAVLFVASAGVADTVTDATYVWFPPDAYVWAALAVTGVLASALAFTVQAAAQTVLPPTRAAIVMTMEPVFAWLTAAVAVPVLVGFGITWLEPERFGGREAVGAVIILGAMVWTEASARPDATVAQVAGSSSAAVSMSSPTAGNPRTSTSDSARSS